MLFLTGGCQAQERKTTKGIVGGPFENADFMFVGLPDDTDAVDTSAGWTEDGQRLLITGRIVEADGHTPAAGVLLYYYHTDPEGRYPNRPQLEGRVRRHGYLRGWVRTGEDGRYSIYTIRPGSYPGRDEPAHIHLSVQEPELGTPYYLNDIVFDDDPLLTAEKRRSMSNRGGSGVVRLQERNGILVAEHNITLGLNIPNYPIGPSRGERTGVKAGGEYFSFPSLSPAATRPGQADLPGL